MRLSLYDGQRRQAQASLPLPLPGASAPASGPMLVGQNSASSASLSASLRIALRALMSPAGESDGERATGLAPHPTSGYDAWLLTGPDCRDSSAAHARLALKARREALVDDPAAAGRHAALAACLLAMGQRGLLDGNGWRHEARASANRAVALDRASPFALDTAAQVAWSLDQRVEKARAYWEEALSHHPYHARIRYQLAALLARQNKRTDALAHFERARLSAPDYPLEGALEILQPFVTADDSRR